jgi:hypothetical protein
LRIFLSKKLITASIEVIAILIESPLLNRADVGMVRDHDIFEIEGDEFTGEGREGDIDVDAE